MLYRLEYSKQQGHFHFENPNKIENKNTNGYLTLGDNIPSELARDFMEAMQVKYPILKLGSLHSDGFPTFDQMKKEFVDFLSKKNLKID